MKKIRGLFFFLFALCISYHAEARVGRGLTTVSAAANPYANACGTQPAGQNWCVGTDGWTVVTPTIGTTGTSCATTGTPTWDGSCITYVSDRGTGTLATCRINAPVGFDFTTDPTNGGADWTKACALTPTVTSAIRNGSSDFLLLQRGSCFIDSPVTTNPCTGTANTTTTYGIGSNTDRSSNFGRAGTSKSKPIVVAAFGPIANSRPKIMTINSCFSGSTGVNNVLVMHIHCDHVWRDPRSAYYIPINSAVSSGAGQKAISNVTASPTTPLIRVTVPSTADLAAQPIYIDQVGGVTAANGTWTSYTIIDGTTVDLVSSTFSGTYTSGGRLGQRQMTVTNPLPAEMGSGTVFRMYNHSSAAQMRITDGTTGNPINSLDGTRTVITLGLNISAGAQATAGDRIQFVSDGGGIGMANEAVDFFRVEGTKISFGSIVLTRITDPVKAWECGFVRNVVEFSYGIQSRNQGFFLGDSYDLSSACEVRENVSDGNGRMLYDMDCIPGDVLPSKCNGVASEMPPGANGLIPDQSHGAYNHEWFGKTDYIGNILTNNSGAGSQLRAGGIAYNNFSARNATDLYSGGIMFDVNFTYNVVAQAGATYWAISKTSAATTSGNVLTFVNAPLWMPLNSSIVILNATSGISLGSRQITSSTTTSLTLDGAAFSVASGDTLYFRYSNVQWGTPVENVGRLNPRGIVDPLTKSNVQWNVALDAVSASQAGGYGGFAFNLGSSTVRKAGSVFANNYARNWALGMEDRSQIQSVDGTGCSGAIRVGLTDNTFFRVGDPIVTSGIAGVTGTVNGSFTIASKPSSTHLCLAGSTYTSGTWTSGTGVINGGVSFANNKYQNLNTISTTAQAAASFSSFVPSGTPTVEFCDSQLGGDGTLAHFVNQAKSNRLGSWNTTWTANSMNNCIRSQTDPSIALQ